MPVREGRPLIQDDETESRLREALVAELREPHESGEPQIIIDRPSRGTIHLYVIWNAWESMDQMIRSRIILDAFALARGEAEALDVTVAMGLSPVEAERLGIK